MVYNPFYINMPKRRYLIILSLLIICTSVFTGAFCFFTVYTSATLSASTGVSLQFTPDERITITDVAPVNPEGKLVQKDAPDTWWCKSGTTVSINASIKEGYSFSGWYNGESKISDTLQSIYTIEAPASLTAKLELIQYQISYETNGGILESEIDSYNTEHHVTLPAPIKSGYLFDGWFEYEDFSGTAITTTDGRLGDRIFYAKWSEDPSLRTAFAVYSANDTSLSFYKRSSVPSVNDIFEGKTVTAVYTGIEELNATRYQDIPWLNDYRTAITSVTAVDTIVPSSIAYWFYYMTKCVSFDLHKFDTSKATSMAYAFSSIGSNASALSIDLSDWDTSNVSNMNSMFYLAGDNAKTFELDLSNWDTSKVENVSQMFYSAGRNASIWTLGNLKTKVVTKADGSTYISWDVSNISNFSSMFSCVGEGADSFTLDISNWNMSGATNISRMFNAFRRNKSNACIELDLSTKAVTLENGTTYTAWDLSNYTGSMYYMFGYAGKLADSFYIDTRGWDTSNVTSMKWMFYGAGMNAKEFYIGELSEWNTGNVTDMECMLRDIGQNADFTMDLSGWDVSKVTTYGNFAIGTDDKITLPAFNSIVSSTLSDNFTVAAAPRADSNYFTVNLDIGNHECIAPNDFFSDTFIIKNKTPYPIKVRESKVTNVDHSKLYSVLFAGWNHKNAPPALCSLENLTTDWYLIEPGDTLKLNLNIYFPSSLGNEYQGADLKAQFIFECKIPENKSFKANTVSTSNHTTVITVPSTGDGTQISSLMTLCIVSVTFGLLLLFLRKHAR